MGSLGTDGRLKFLSAEQFSDAVAPYQNYIGPIYVANLVTFSDPSKPSATYQQTFFYEGAWLNVQGRGFAGFEAIAKQDLRNNLWETWVYDLTFPYTGLLTQDIVSLQNTEAGPIGNLTQTPALITLNSATYNERYFPYASNVTVQNWEVGGAENGDLITTTSTNYTFDNYGNATNIVRVVTDNDPGYPTKNPYQGNTWTANTTNTTDISVNQSEDLAAWCLNILDATQVIYSSTLSGSTSVTRTKNFTPDTPSACRVNATITEPTSNSGLYKVTEALTFDSFGNVATDTITGANMPNSPASRLTTLNWGTTGQFLNTVTDPSTATTTWTYGTTESLAFGVPDNVKDANNLTTSWTYDAFGRKSWEQRPDKTWTFWNWLSCTSYCGWNNSAYQIQQTQYQTNQTTAIRVDTTTYDPIDRITQTQGPNVSGGTATIQKLYNSLGLLVQQSQPFLSGGTAYQLTYNYDLINRLIETERPVRVQGGQTNCNPATVPPVAGCQGTSYAYAGRTHSVTDPLGDTTTTLTDVNGWLRQTQDALGYKITRVYDAAGSVTGITDSVGNTLLSGVSYAYGIQPFKLAETDPDLGARAYTIDSLGEPIGWTDAHSPPQSFSMTYDALSRPKTRTEPDLFTEWNYGSGAPNWGRLTSECTASATTSNLCTTSGSSWLYNESQSYDSSSRLQYDWVVQSGNPGNDSNPVTSASGGFLFTLGYSATTGFPASFVYPKSTSGTGNPLSLSYGYAYGLLQSVTDASDTMTTCGITCVLWTANAANAFGEVTQETLGNGVVTNRTFDNVTGWLTGATAGVGGGAGLINQSYSYFETGDLSLRQNNNPPGLNEAFSYDADRRLTCTALASTCTTPTIVYDGGVAGPGNITSQTGVGTYSYPAAGQPRPHAVSSLTGTLNGIVNPHFSYDGNGNMTDRATSTQNIYWSSYNYPITISGSDATGTEEVQLSYGPDRQRWHQIYTVPGTTENTYYIGGLMDLVSSGSAKNYRHYIYAGNEPVAVYSRTAAGVNTMSYLIEDHQGSVSAIASKSGSADVSESFTAFGQRRNPATWLGPPTTSDLNTIAGLSRQGYTFQTWLGQSMGLNHMNGRVQDAILGRFLSPDPHSGDENDAQSYNRYTYVNNNPLTFWDPTGFECRDIENHITPCDPSGEPTPADTQPGATYSVNSDGSMSVTSTGSRSSSNGPPSYDPGTSDSGGGNSGGGGGKPPTRTEQPAQGHEYQAESRVCQRQLTPYEQRDLISRFTVPNVYTQGQPKGPGTYMVASSLGFIPGDLGIPGGWVTTTFSADGLVGTNITTPFHIFSGTVTRSISNTGSGAYMVTHGYGGYPSLPPPEPNASSLTTAYIDLGGLLDQINDQTGPVVFSGVDQAALAYATLNYPGC